MFSWCRNKGRCKLFSLGERLQWKCDYYFHKSSQRTPIYRYDYLDSKNAGIVVRDPQAYSILEKIEQCEGAYYNDINNNFSGLVSAKHFFDDSKF